jgi:2-keto-3-deoxy-L-rhamnonate aldolase RhmA
VAAARAHGKHVGMGGVREDAHWARFIGLGVRMVLTENDLTLLMNRARERARFFGALQDAACGARA